SSSSDQRSDFREAVEELKYRRSLKIALDVLTQNGSARQVPPSEGPNSPLSQKNNLRSLSSTPLRRDRSIFKEKLEPETSKKKREQRNNPSVRSSTRNPAQTSPLILEGSGTNASRCGPGASGGAAASDGQNCNMLGAKSPPGEDKPKPRLLPKPSPGNKASSKAREGRGRPRGAGSAAPCGSDFPEGQAQPPSGEGSPLSAPCMSEVVPARRTNTRRTLLNSLCKSASEDLEENISSESKSLAKQLDGRKKAESLKRVNGEEEAGGTVSSSRKRRCRGCPGPSAGPPDHGTLLSQPKEEENHNTSAVVTSKIKQFQLPDFEEEEEPQAIEEGILVWCKLRRYPYWPAVVKYVRRKPRRACVLLIDGTTSEKKKGFSVSLKNLKHFDCEEKQELIERAREGYRQEIEWCIQLISDYRIRVGCRSFTGSFLEYLAADISYPVRKEGYQGSVQMTFPNEAEENAEESPSETSPPKPPKKLLPDRSRAARDRANKKIVEFIVKTKGAEEHLLAILKSRKQSRWLKEFLNSSQYMTCVETYLEDEEQLDLVVNYLKEVYHGIDAKNLHQIGGDGIKLISDVLLPEAIIYAIAAVDDIDYKKAEEKYIKGPSVSKR
ncbi:MUM1 protein, partial [Brachypteracias leptosomus]|nr:MUM1 protein [Brachypteracias leptosomus]